MNAISKITLSTVTALATFAPGALAASDYQAHVTLGRTIRSTGISLKINPSTCWSRNAYGWYWAAGNEMVICQQNKQSFGVEARWTEEDLDTLRHEAQHMVQDCMDGERQGSLMAVYQKPIELAQSVLGNDGIQRVIKAYSGASDHIKVMELEAFSVAQMNDPMEQVRDIQKFCF